MHQILTIGEPMVVFIAQQYGSFEKIDTFSKSVAGSELNVAVGLAKLGHSVTYMTRIGKDPFGQYIYDFLSNNNINTQYIKFDSNFLTGFYLKFKAHAKDPDIFYYRKHSASSHMSPNDIVDINFDNISHLHITGITPALSTTCSNTIQKIVDISRKNNISISFDPNIREQLWKNRNCMIKTLNNIAFQSTIFLPGINEAKLLTGYDNLDKISSYYIDKGVKLVIIKLGSKGAYVSTKNERFMVNSFKVNNIVDTVGAGDGFAVGIISGLLEGLKLKQAVIRANAIGAMVIMKPGDNDGLPNKKQLEDFIKENNRNT